MVNNRKYGKWQVKKTIGSGREGRCYLVLNMETDRPAALKIPNGQNTLPNEVAALKRMDHPNVLKLIEYDLEADHPYMVTEYCENGTLRQAQPEKWDMEKKVIFYRQLCEGIMHTLEQNVAISGLHSSNVFIKKDNIPVIGDFGSCHTPEYCSEQMLREAKARILGAVGNLYYEIMEGAAANRKLAHSIPKSITANDPSNNVHERLKKFGTP